MAKALYAAELRTIASLIEVYDKFYNDVSALNNDDVVVDWDESAVLSVYAGGALLGQASDKLGTVGWTDDGSIGFTVSEDA